MRTDFIKAELNNSFFIAKLSSLNEVMKVVNDGIPRTEHIEVSNGNVVYQESGNVAIISISGGMYKKDMSAMCMSVVSYPEIIKAIDRADMSEKIDTTLFRVDTPGGHVDGAEEVAEAIENASNKTVTLFENTGASGGMWIFTASNEVYAIKQTMLGSIGVVASYSNKEDESGRIELTSSNAPNKRCTLGEDCKTKLQVMLDGYEDMFFDRMIKNTGFDKKHIKETFNNGGMIFANQAKKAGYIKSVIPFKSLLAKLKNGGVNHESTIASAQINENSTEGNSMENLYTKESFEALKSSHAEALKAEGIKLSDATTALVAMTAERDAATASLSAIEEKTKLKADILPEVLAMAFDKGASIEVTTAMAQADSLDDAKLACFEAMGTDGAFGANTSGVQASSENAWSGHFNNK